MTLGSSIMESAKLPVKHMPIAPTPGPPHSLWAWTAKARSHTTSGLDSFAANALKRRLMQPPIIVIVPPMPPGGAPSLPNRCGM